MPLPLRVGLLDLFFCTKPHPDTQRDVTGLRACPAEELHVPPTARASTGSDQCRSNPVVDLYTKCQSKACSLCLGGFGAHCICSFSLARDALCANSGGPQTLWGVRSSASSLPHVRPPLPSPDGKQSANCALFHEQAHPSPSSLGVRTGLEHKPEHNRELRQTALPLATVTILVPHSTLAAWLAPSEVTWLWIQVWTTLQLSLTNTHSCAQAGSQP